MMNHIHSAWAAVNRALGSFTNNFFTKSLAPSLMVGHGVVSKSGFFLMTFCFHVKYAKNMLKTSMNIRLVCFLKKKKITIPHWISHFVSYPKRVFFHRAECKLWHLYSKHLIQVLTYVSTLQVQRNKHFLLCPGTSFLPYFSQSHLYIDQIIMMRRDKSWNTWNMYQALWNLTNRSL